MERQGDHAFDTFAGDYEGLINASIGASGETAEYFDEYKRRLLERALGSRFELPLLDFGCGVGRLTRQFVKSFKVVHGFDPSSESVRRAKEEVPDVPFFSNRDDLVPGTYGAVVIANVLHHVPVAERDALLSGVRKLLVPGGSVFVIEHNPYNPMTRHAVAACELDADAVLLTAREVRTRLARAGLADVKLDYIVFFPRFLAKLRPLEPLLRAVPLGAQVFAQAKNV